MRRFVLALVLLTPFFLAACVNNPCDDTSYLHVRTVHAASVLQRSFFKLPMSRRYAIADLPPGSPPLTSKNRCLIVPPVVTPRPSDVPGGESEPTKHGG
jgi:hypothetical protein